jgi:hypothetical protein
LREQASSGEPSITQEGKEDSDFSRELEEEPIEIARDGTLRELAAPLVDQPPLCIDYPDLDVDFELKSGLIHLLPKFRGLENEDPHKHLKAFHVVCSSMKPHGISEEQLNYVLFHFL